MDLRSRPGRQFVFIVEADPLESFVNDDWSGFDLEYDEVRRSAAEVEGYIANQIGNLFKEVRLERKRDQFERNRNDLVDLGKVSQSRVAEFVDTILVQCPTLTQNHLDQVVGVFVKLEKSRSGHALLAQLASLSADELDLLHEILERWSVREATVVLALVRERLELIRELERLVEDKDADELHVLHPLFDSGLWMFGYEYESAEFRSNRSLLTVIRELLGDKATIPENYSQRPDFVAVPDGTIGAWSCDSYNDDSHVDGIDSVLIIELKKGGSQLTRKDIHQPEDYIWGLMQSGRIQDSTKINAYVLGSTLDSFTRSDLGRRKTLEGERSIFAMTYSTILRRAHARMYNLENKLRKVIPDIEDPEMQQVINREVQSSLELD